MKNIGILIIILLIAAGGIGYKLMAKSSSNFQPPVSVAENSRNHVKSSMKQLLGLGKSVSCEMNTNDDQGITTGKINISGQKMMGSFEITDKDGKMMNSHMVNDGEFTYMWSSATPQGTKIKNDAVTPAKSGQAQNNFDEDKEVDMDCSDWTPSTGSFTAPRDVEFLDMSNMMKGIREKSEEPVSTGKSVCDAVTDPQAKAVCLQQVGN